MARSLRAVVFGAHSALVSEPLSMLRYAVPPASRNPALLGGMGCGEDTWELECIHSEPGSDQSSRAAW